jgi:hypothetical protein
MRCGTTTFERAANSKVIPQIQTMGVMIGWIAGRPTQAPNIGAALQDADLLLEVEAPGIDRLPEFRVGDPLGDLRKTF